MIMNYYKFINKERFQIDIVANGIIEQNFEKVFKINGSHIYRTNRKRNPIKYFGQVYNIVKKERYDVVHVHGNSATMTIELLAAKLGGCSTRIAHSHTSACEHKILHFLLSPLFKHLYTCALACSQMAGDWIFGEKKYKVLYNGIEIDKYKFSENVRDRIRKELKLENKFVLGHVGYMNETKNHKKIFSVLTELKKRRRDVHLLCVTGSESIPDDLQMVINNMGIEDDITVLFKRNDVNELLQAMDVFVFPSKWEGLGIALIEAQTSGLICVASDRVPKLVNITNNVEYMSLELSSKEWIKTIESKYNKNVDRTIGYEMVKRSDYNIANNIALLEEIYGD